MFELNMNEYAVCDSIFQMSRLSRSGKCDKSSTELASFLGIDRTTVSRAINKLEEKCLIMDMETTFLWADAVTYVQNAHEITDTRAKCTPNVQNARHSITNNSKNSYPLSQEKEMKLDSDGNPLESVVSQGKKKSWTKQYETFLTWAEKRRGFKFVNRTSQYKALQKARLAEVSPEKLYAKWEHLESDSRFEEKGFDWHTVLWELDKKQP